MDHPRSRGEYDTTDNETSNVDGSSPLSRGIQRMPAEIDRRYGIIPALAGNTSPTTPPPGVRWDHPRSRGEYLVEAVLDVGSSGSSPLSRGIHSARRRRGYYPRIIPALAGNTLITLSGFVGITDHPRSRGEYAGVLEARVLVYGSSPLSRGIR